MSILIESTLLIIYLQQIAMEHQNQAQTILQMFSFGKVRLPIDVSNPYHVISIEGKNFSQYNQQLRPNRISVSFKLVLHECLNQCLKPKARLFELWLKSLKIQMLLQTRPGQFCFEQMHYFMFLKAVSNKPSDQCRIIVRNVQQSFKRTEIDTTILVERMGSAIQEAEYLKQLAVCVGSKERKEIVRANLIDLTIESTHSKGLNEGSEKEGLRSEKNVYENKFKFIDKEYSLPLGIFAHNKEIYSSLGIVQNCTLQQIQSLISSLLEHKCPEPQPDNKMYICHDMKGGYQEDIFFDNNMVHSSKNQNLAYRCLHLEQAQIFNYFSHHNITIPPRHWRVQCKRFGTRCLGTFITERNDYHQSVLCSKEFALLLVALARKCQFDGYLINIERNIDSLTSFKQWLEYFTMKMHQFVPNSTVIWYDSISAKDGVVKYQNALTRQNYEFFHFTDGIFTNYWWNPELLKQTAELKGQNKRKVYIGNDCFGRNTYGGGQLDIYKAANQIFLHKNQLSIALFAPAFTYQRGGQKNRSLFHLLENGLYKGINTQMIPLQNWKEKKDKTSGGWQKQGEWTVSSYGQCQRSLRLNFKPLKQGQDMRVMLMCQVACTPPLFESQYKIILQILGGNGEILLETDTYNFFNYKTTKKQTQLATQQILATYAALGEQEISVRVIILAQSKQKWAGFFGPRFANEVVTVQTFQKERHWTSKIPIAQVQVGQPYHSYCNLGVGDHFFNKGVPLQKHYNFLADMDLPHTHIINSPLDTQICYEQAFMGGTSLTIKRESIKLLKLYIAEGIDLREEYWLQVTVKGTQGLTAVCKYISKKEEDRVFTAKMAGAEDINDWKRFTFKLVSGLKQLTAPVRSIIDLTSIKYPYQLGEIKLIKGRKPESSSIQCLLQTSESYVAADKYYFNLTIKSQSYQRLFVLIDKVGLFAYFSDGVAVLRDVALQKMDILELQIIDTDLSLENQTLRIKVVEGEELSQLLFKGSLAF